MYEYTVQPHDTLSQIVFSMYGIAPGDSRCRGAMQHLLTLNPEIKDPNRIRIGQILRVTEYPPPHRPPFVRGPHSGLLESIYADDPDGRTLGRELNGNHFLTDGVEPASRNAFWALAWLEHHANWLTIPGGIAFGSTAHLLSPGNVALIERVGELYARYQAGYITKGVYDAQRRIHLSQFRHNMGPAERLLFGRHTTHQTIRIARAGGVPARPPLPAIVSA